MGAREQESNVAASHPFTQRPHRTLLALALPIFVSLVAEPLTGLVDTAFVTRLGSDALAALGVGTVVLSGVFWIFNFLSIGTQTEVARAHGAGERERAAEVSGLALIVSVVLGVGLAALGQAWAAPIARWMAAEGEVHAGAVTYLRIRVLGAPALLVMVAAFGCLRGLQLMRVPLWIALGANLANVLLDYLLIFGVGPLPALGIAGAAWASVASQYLGAAWALAAVLRRLGLPAALRRSDLRLLFVAGRDLFLRTALLTTFLVLGSRAATGAGAEAGAAHQAIRQVWLLAALALDAFAATAQSLVGYFVGAREPALARRAAGASLRWGVAAGVSIGASMLLLRAPVEELLVPEGARALFRPAWLLCALFQPLNAVSFVTDGVHWATRDYRYLRNAMLLATASGALLLTRIDIARPDALALIWAVTGLWISIRAVLGAARIGHAFRTEQL